MDRFTIVFDEQDMELLEDIEKEMHPFNYPSGMEPTCAKLGAQIALSWLVQKKRAEKSSGQKEGERSVDDEKRRQSIVRGLEWLKGSCETLLQAVDTTPVDPDVDLNDMAQLLKKVNPMVSRLIEDFFGDGEQGDD